MLFRVRSQPKAYTILISVSLDLPFPGVSYKGRRAICGLVWVLVLNPHEHLSHRGSSSKIIPHSLLLRWSEWTRAAEILQSSPDDFEVQPKWRALLSHLCWRGWSVPTASTSSPPIYLLTMTMWFLPQPHRTKTALSQAFPAFLRLASTHIPLPEIQTPPSAWAPSLLDSHTSVCPLNAGVSQSLLFFSDPTHCYAQSPSVYTSGSKISIPHPNINSELQNNSSALLAFCWHLNLSIRKTKVIFSPSSAAYKRCHQSMLWEPPWDLVSVLIEWEDLLQWVSGERAL